MRYLLALALFVAGCGVPHEDSEVSTEDIRSPIIVDATLMPYLDKFVSDVGGNVSGISVYFGPLPAPTVGRCTRYANGDRTITIDPTYWGGADADSKENVVYHELGHCGMNLGHNDALDSLGCPVSIMYKDVFGALPCYGQNKAYYYNELKSHL